MKKKGIILLLIMAVTFNFYSSVYAVEGWEADLTVSILHIEANKLSFGQRADATDEKDGRYDIIGILSGDLIAYFPHKDGGYWSDIKALTPLDKKVWDIRIESRLKGEKMVLKWNPKSLPDKGDVVLVDIATGAITNMRGTNSYSYQNKGERDLRVEVTP